MLKAIFRLLPLWLATSLLAAAPKPNVIFILTDDQGYGDLSCHGNPILKTPNLDRFHDESARFTDFHVSPTCSPTRSVLNTGRHEFRNGVTHTIYGRERMTLSAVTIAQVLKGAGYTTGIFGKWHLGDQPEYQPGRRGFDETFIHGSGVMGTAGDAPGNTYFNPYILHNGKFEKTQGYCTDVFFRQALQWIGSVKGRQPFYAYIPCNAPHLPLQVPAEYEQMYAGKIPTNIAKVFGTEDMVSDDYFSVLGNDPTNVAKYFGMIANIDDNVGRLIRQLADWGIERDTLVVFMNDNGGTIGNQVYNSDMRGVKETPWLGGTRAISFWRWPGTIQPADIGDLTAHLDFFPTIAELAGAPPDARVQAQVEGRSLVPLLKNPQAPWPDRIIVQHVGRWDKGKAAQSKYANCSIRTTRWQMVCVSEKADKQWQLFDVKADPGERHNVAAQNPEVVAELDAAYDKWWDSVQPQLVNEDAVMPKVQPYTALFRQQMGGGTAK